MRTEVSRVGHHINSLDQWSTNPKFINSKSENHINRSGKDTQKKVMKAGWDVSWLV